MTYKIHQAVVIGAGTMGAAIAAHLANTGVRVTLLDIVPNRLTPEEEKKGLSLSNPLVRNRIVREGLDRAMKSRPASFFSSDQVSLVTTGNLEDDFAVVGQADWVIEVIVENLKIKQGLMERIDAVRAPNTIVSTNTSGIPVSSIAEGRSQGFKRHFLGTHFFNPPRYLKLVEVIPTSDTLPEVTAFISRFLEFRLGKGVVPAKDTPNFIGNRLFSGSGAYAMDYILRNGYTVDEVDAITGPLVGHPKTATFRLIDLVGIDVWEHVGSNLGPLIPHDEYALRYLNSEVVNNLIHTMVEKGWLGNKTRQGFYKEVRQADGSREFWVLNLQTFEYEPPKKPRFESVGQAKDIPDLGDRLKIMLSGQDKAAQLVQAVTYYGLAYASRLIPEVADTPKPMDDAMRWGFSHEAGPFETWDRLGVAETAERMQQAGFQTAPWVQEMLDSGHPTFYKVDGERKAGAYNPALREYQPIPRDPSMIILKEQREVARNENATVYDLGDGVAHLDMHAKANAIDDDMMSMFDQALDCLDKEFDGLVISTEADDFSLGANIFYMVMAAQNQMFDELERAVRRLQDFNMRIRYSPKPVVVAPAGRALGGGAEMIMHASRVVAASELYTGLVEIGPGLIPAGGGTKEMLRRILNPPMRTDNAEPLAYLQRIFQQIGLAKVSFSAEEARQLGILNPWDRVVMNRSHLVMEAKREVQHMVATGYHPPVREKIYAAGRDALGALRVGIYMFKKGGSIFEHESVIAGKLAYVMTGGELSRPAWVDEQYLLDLEREAILSLFGMEKTQQRMWHILQTSKPLRN